MRARSRTLKSCAQSWAALLDTRGNSKSLPWGRSRVPPRLLAAQTFLAGASGARFGRALPGDKMSNRTVQLLLAGCLMTGTLWAADNPFIGKWKVYPSKSKLYDEMKVDVAGANRYVLTFGPGQTDTIVADGSDQPALSGTTLSIKVKGPNSWEVTRKLKGRTLLTAQWTLSADGKTLNDAFTQYLPDGMTLFSQPLPNGSTLFLPYVYQRTAGDSGF